MPKMIRCFLIAPFKNRADKVIRGSRAPGARIATNGGALSLRAKSSLSASGNNEAVCISEPMPNKRTDIGKKFLSEDPETPGSLGIAISEAIEVAAKDEKTRYALGSVLNHVLMHQTIIGEEALKQLELTGDYPDVIVGCTGGGSNFAGLFTPFARENIQNNKSTVI